MDYSKENEFNRNSEDKNGITAASVHGNLCTDKIIQ